MVNHQRMSPLTALFIGVFGLASVGVVSGASVVLYALHIIDSKASNILDFTEVTVQNLPEILDSLPGALADIFHHRRMPAYAANIDVDVSFVLDKKRGTMRPTLTITNNGDEVVSMLAVRVAALNNSQIPVREWTEVVATPIALDDDEWRGPMMPGAVRHVLMHSGWRGIALENAESITGVVEISEIRVWEPRTETVVSLTTQ